MQRHFQLPLLIIIGFFLTFLLTWPLVLRIKTFYPDVSEYALVGWMLWYNQNSITTGRIFDSQAYFNSNQFYPLPLTLAYSENLFIPSLIFAPIYLLTKDLVFSVNFFAILTFVLTFVSSFYCLSFFLKEQLGYQEKRRSIFSRINLAGLIGAFVFTFNPLTFAQFFGHHLQFLSKFFLPPLFLFAYFYIKKPSWKNAFLFFLFFTLNCLSNIYFEIFSILFVPLFWSPFLIKELFKKNTRYFLNLLKTSLVFLVFLPVLYYFNLPYLQFSSLEGVTRTVKENSDFSARGVDWISSLKMNLVYGKFVQSLDYLREPKEPNGFFNYTEHTIFPNVVPVLLVILSVFAWTSGGTFWAFILILFFSAYFTFGPFFHSLNGKEITATSFYNFLYQHLFILQGIRVPTRFQFIFYFPFAFFVGLGAFRLAKRSGRFSGILMVAVLFFMVLENINIVKLDSPAQILQYMESNNTNQPDLIKLLKGKKTIHFPVFTVGPANNTRYLSWSTVTGETIFNGYSGYFPADWGTLADEMNLLDNKALEKMFLLNLDFLVIHKDLPGQVNVLSGYESQKLLSQNIVFEDWKVKVIDLKRLNFNPVYCKYRDLKFEIGNTVYPVAQINGTIFQLFPKIRIVNPKNCYLVNKYQDRYSKVEFMLGGKKQILPIKLPIVIEPYQKINLN